MRKRSVRITSFILLFAVIAILLFFIGKETGPDTAQPSFLLFGFGMVAFAILLYLSLAYVKVYKLKKFNSILKNFSEQNNLRFSPGNESVLDSGGYSAIVEGKYGSIKLSIKGFRRENAEQGFLIKADRTFSDTILLKYFPKSERIINFHLKGMLPNPLRLLEPSVKRPKKIIEVKQKEIKQNYVVFCDNQDFSNKIIRQLTFDELITRKVTLYISPAGLIYYQSKLPKNLKELMGEVDEAQKLLNKMGNIPN
jgi:hypothetical protein